MDERETDDDIKPITPSWAFPEIGGMDFETEVPPPAEPAPAAPQVAAEQVNVNLDPNFIPQSRLEELVSQGVAKRFTKMMGRDAGMRDLTGVRKNSLYTLGSGGDCESEPK